MATQQEDNGANNGAGLLDLPPEIWSYICTLAVVEKWWIHAWDGATSRGVARAVVQPAITRTCKTIRAETLPVFYSRNVFCFTVAVNQVTRYNFDCLGEWISLLLDRGLWRHVTECRIRTFCSGGSVCGRLQRLLDECRAEAVDVSLCARSELWVWKTDNDWDARPTYKILVKELGV